ncbi:MAG TPA: cytochrome c biogenesis protein CcdA, partial [Chloroflexota bacterium]|nr:cytochrome c biogenesis protein CcdA [Chloroflexota bacterium]
GVAAGLGSAVANAALALPLTYAFGAGMVSAVNPCGFAILPAYVGFYLGAQGPRDARGRVPQRLFRALWVSAAVTAGFVLLFGAAGLVLSVATTAVARYFPWMALAVGVLLVLVGGSMLTGRTLHTNLGEQLADRMGPAARQKGARGYLAYGLAYAAASLSCQLPVFLAVVASALTAGGFLGATLQFVLFALGMGLAITVLTVATAFVESAGLLRVRRAVRYVQPVSAGLLLLGGAFIIYYWLTVGGLLGGTPMA